METDITVLDIETTGLTVDSELVSYTLGMKQFIRDPGEPEENILYELARMMQPCREDLLITFSGAPKYGPFKGLDIPFLRNRYIQNGMIDEFPFLGMQHLDVSDMAVKFLITATEEPAQIDDLSADQVIKLMNVIDRVPTKTKKANIAMLGEIEDPEKLAKIHNFMNVHGESKLKEHKSLDSICLNVFNNFGEDLTDEITGSDVPWIWDRYCTTKDDRCKIQIMNHNLQDAKKTYLLFRALEKLTSYRPITTL